MKDFTLLRRKKLADPHHVQYTVQEKDRKGAESFNVVLHEVYGKDPLEGQVDCRLKIVEDRGQKSVTAMCINGVYIIKRVWKHLDQETCKNLPIVDRF